MFFLVVGGPSKEHIMYLDFSVISAHKSVTQATLMIKQLIPSTFSLDSMSVPLTLQQVPAIVLLGYASPALFSNLLYTFISHHLFASIVPKITSQLV